MRLSTTLFLVAALLAIAPARAAPPEFATIRVNGTDITIPSPPGLVPLINKQSHYYRFGARMQEANRNSLLAYFLPAKEAAIADIDQLPSPTQWGIVYGVEAMMNRAVSVEQLRGEILPSVEREISATVKDPALRKRIGEGTDANMEQLGRELKLDAGKLRMGEISPLGAFAKGDNYATYGAATRIRVEYGGKTTEAPVIAVIAFVVVKERLFCFAVYRAYGEEKDIVAARRDATIWAETITRANARP